MRNLLNSKTALVVILLLLTAVAWIRWRGGFHWSSEAPQTQPGASSPSAGGATGRSASPGLSKSGGRGADAPSKNATNPGPPKPAPVNKRIADAQKELEAAVAALNRAEDRCGKSLASAHAYKLARDARNAAAERVQRTSDPEMYASATRDLMRATQTLSNLTRAALDKDPEVLAAREKAKASRQTLDALSKPNPP